MADSSSFFTLFGCEHSSSSSSGIAVLWWNLASSKIALKHLALNFRSYSKEHIFYGLGLSAPCPTPNLKHQNIPFCLGHHFDLSGIRYPTNFYTTASIALRIISPCTFHHYIKVGKASYLEEYVTI